MKIYKIKYNTLNPLPKAINIPAGSEFGIEVTTVNNVIDFTSIGCLRIIDTNGNVKTPEVIPEWDKCTPQKALVFITTRQCPKANEELILDFSKLDYADPNYSIIGTNIRLRGYESSIYDVDLDYPTQNESANGGSL